MTFNKFSKAQGVPLKGANDVSEKGAMPAKVKDLTDAPPVTVGPPAKPF